MQRLYNSQTVSQVLQLTNTTWTLVCILKLYTFLVITKTGRKYYRRRIRVAFNCAYRCMWWCLKTIPSGSEVVLSSGLMTGAHSGIYSTFCMSLLCIPPADGYGSQPAVILINGTIKFTASVYFILLMRVCFRSIPLFFFLSATVILLSCSIVVLIWEK